MAMKGTDDARQVSSLGHIHLFDQDGLPWSSQVHWGILLFWVAVFLFALAPLVGIYLGIWLISKGKSALSLILYLALAGISVLAFFAPFPTHGALSAVEIVLEMSDLVLWLVGAFALRRDVIRYYSGREGIPFSLNPALTAFFGPWYVGGLLRADFPLDGSGQVGAGVLKLIV
jgi:hypothetical protein